MQLANFIALAMEGYSVRVKNGVLERISTTHMKRVFSYVKKEENTFEDNLRTILAFIEAFKESQGIVAAHLAALLLIEPIKKQEVLSSHIMLSTYQNIIDIELILRDDFTCFTKLSLDKQKEYIDIILGSSYSLAKRRHLSKALLLQNFFGVDIKENAIVS